MSAREGSWGPRAHLAAFAALFAIAMVPLASTVVPPLVDYPNHLARMYVLFEASNLDPIRNFYAPAWALLPNLAMEGVMPVLLTFLPVEVAGKVFVALTLFTLASGTLVLHYVLFRRLSPWPLVVMLLLYNRTFLWGFLNYLFAVGLALWLFAGWVYGRGAGAVRRTLIFTPLALLLLTAHLYAFGVYALCVGGYELGLVKWRRAQWRTVIAGWIPAAITLGVPLAAFLLFSPTTDGAGVFQYGRLMRKLAALVGLFNNYDRAVDGITITVLFLLAVLALWRRKVVIAPPMRWPLAILALGFIAMPATLFTSHGTDVRYTIAFALFAVAAVDLVDLAPRWRYGAAAILVTLFVGRMAVIQHYWLRADNRYGEFLNAFERLPVGSRLFTAEGETIDWQPFPIPTAHLPCLAIIRQQAFVPSLFHYPTQQPLRLRGEFGALARGEPEVIVKDNRPVPWWYVLQHYTHVLVIDEHGPVTLPRAGLAPVASAPHFRLFRVIPGAAADWPRVPALCDRCGDHPPARR